MKKIIKFLLINLFFNSVHALPAGFVYLHDIDPSILQDMRYAGKHNFVGHPVEGYRAPVCILTLPAAQALAKVQKALKPFSFSLKVYDCYRPTRAVVEFMRWSQEPNHQEMKTEFYPRVNKSDLFKLGYIAKKSGHSRGSTIDLTLVALPPTKQAAYHKGQTLVSCLAPQQQRFRDNSINMGTGYDCLDERAYPGDKTVNTLAQHNRNLLRKLMMQQGFVPYDKEWWHFTLRNEPYPNTYFNFIVR